MLHQYYPDAFTSIAASSQRSPVPLEVQPQVTKPAVALTVELDAPVIAPGTLTFHCCVQVGVESVLPPQIAGESKTQLFGNCVVIDIMGLPAAVLWVAALVGIGFT